MSRPSNKHDRREKDNKNNTNFDKQVTKRVVPYKRPKSNRPFYQDPLLHEEEEVEDDGDIAI